MSIEPKFRIELQEDFTLAQDHVYEHWSILYRT
jgi:hypothetical protein